MNKKFAKLEEVLEKKKGNLESYDDYPDDNEWLEWITLFSVPCRCMLWLSNNAEHSQLEKDLWLIINNFIEANKRPVEMPKPGSTLEERFKYAEEQQEGFSDEGIDFMAEAKELWETRYTRELQQRIDQLEYALRCAYLANLTEKELASLKLLSEMKDLSQICKISIGRYALENFAGSSWLVEGSAYEILEMREKALGISEEWRNVNFFTPCWTL